MGSSHFVLFWRRGWREEHQEWDFEYLRDAFGEGLVAVLTLSGEEVADAGVVREAYGFGELADAIGGFTARVLHGQSEDLWVTEGVALVQRVSIGTVWLSIGTVKQIESAASTDPNG